MPLPFPCIAIIPARYGSTRFPGKPLTPILGRPMFWHVARRAQASPSIQAVYLATDDERIAREAELLDIPAIMTSPKHSSGTDRILEAACSLDLHQDTVVVNIQGDEPGLDPHLVDRLVEPFLQPEVQVSTAARILGPEYAEDPNLVKVVRAWTGQALYFSRAPIPHTRDGQPEDVLLHIGMYAFRLPTLRRFHQLGPSPLEKKEKLEQLRLLEAGIPIHVVLTDHQCYGVDRPEDVARVEAILRKEQGECAQY
ncbi:3-deoxy-manno-octulosonate cytidylyltransferase [Desulfovermiculus halophilus]|jgi:3-deoxy-manno-octulosonate cytidylyltransferase (CMP-KDO synthetase)|uniref:3-deoxy-manno-octulosonate cytidylyltransferase n=1 Tax=Desulfovermiculus halophilus TaxID=339722 RepID=UPI000487915A|nr:3-deoxy-manno-octulosonate cytidylyltransferase [Desulfovermiculus halophilus]